MAGAITSELEKQCHYFLMEGLAPSTRRSYSTGQKRFIEFCSLMGKVNKYGSPCPAEEWTLCLFATYLASTLKHSSIKVYLSAVRALHVEWGFPDPLLNCLRLQRVVRGIKRMQGTGVAARLPVTKEIMLLIYNSLDLHHFDHVMFWSACCLAYFGFLRSSEFTTPSATSFSPSYHLTLQDIAFDSLSHPSQLRVFIKASKTDPFRRGCTLYIGKGKDNLCAVSALCRFLQIRGNARGPLFVKKDGYPLTRVALTAWLRQIISAAGLDGNYSSHSFRIGAATVASRNGIPDHIIQSLGRWSSSAYQCYIRTSPEELSSFAQKLS